MCVRQCLSTRHLCRSGSKDMNSNTAAAPLYGSHELALYKPTRQRRFNIETGVHAWQVLFAPSRSNISIYSIDRGSLSFLDRVGRQGCLERSVYK